MSEPRELPAGWAWATLGVVAEVRLGRQRSPDRHTGPMPRPYLRAANVTWNGLDLSDVNTMDFTDDEAAIYQLRDGDVLLNEASGSAAEVGKPALYRGEIPGCCFQNTLVRVRPGPLLDSQFVCAQLKHHAREGRFVEHGKGIGINHIGAAKMNAWPIALPPLAEQRRIVAKLDELLARSRRAREELAEVPALLARYRESVLAAAFRGDLTADWREAHPEVEHASALLERIWASRRFRIQQGAKSRSGTLGREQTRVGHSEGLPSSWDLAVWDDLADWITYGFTRPMPHVHEGVPIVTARHIDRSMIDFDTVDLTPQSAFDSLSDKDRPRRGEILVTKDGSIGRAAVVNTDRAFCINQSVAVIRFGGERPSIIRGARK